MLAGMLVMGEKKRLTHELVDGRGTDCVDEVYYYLEYENC